MSKIGKAITVLGLAWIGYIGYLYIYAFATAKPFEYYLTGECPQINIHVLPPKLNYATVSYKEYVELIAWFDKTTDQQIFITNESYRKYGSLPNCTKQKLMAFIKKESAERGIIQPELRIKYWYMLALMLVPPSVLALLVALPLNLLGRRRRLRI